MGRFQLLINRAQSPSFTHYDQMLCCYKAPCCSLITLASVL